MSVVRVTCALIRKDDLYLVVQRPPHKAEALKWEFPGGKVEAGESDDVCIVREIREELGIAINLHGRLRLSSFRTADRTILLLPFLATLGAGTIVLHEHCALKWVGVEELGKLDLSATDRDLLPLLREAGLEEQAWWSSSPRP